MPKQANNPKTKTRSFRLPLELSNRLDNYVNEKDTTLTNAVVELLEAGLKQAYSKEDEAPATKEDLQKMGKQIEIYQDQLTNLQDAIVLGFAKTQEAIQNQPLQILPPVDDKPLLETTADEPENDEGKMKDNEDAPKRKWWHFWKE